MKVERIRLTVGVIVSLLLMVAALWMWNRAALLADDATRPEVERWAFRSAAVSAAAGAQLALLTFAAGRLYHRRRFTSDALRLSASFVAGVALVSAVALGLAGGLAGRLI